MMIVAILLVTGSAVLLAMVQSTVHEHLIGKGRMSQWAKTLWGFIRLAGVSGIAWITVRDMEGSLTGGVLLVAGCMALTSFIFRSDLNHRKGWHAHYLGSTSLYDRLAICLTILWNEGYWSWSRVRLQHSKLYHESEEYKAMVHRAGSNLSDAELITYAVFCLLSVLF